MTSITQHHLLSNRLLRRKHSDGSSTISSSSSDDGGPSTSGFEALPPAHADTARDWRREWRSHPNSARVADWLVFHQSVRDQLAQMGELLGDATRLVKWAGEGAHGVGPDAGAELLGRFAADFERFTSRLSQHADYEDTVLFPFMAGAVPGLGDMLLAGQGGEGTLGRQHREMERSEAAMQVLLAHLAAASRPGSLQQRAPIPALSEQLRATYQSYYHLIIEHLALEEGALVAPWLHLSDKQMAANHGAVGSSATHAVPSAAAAASSPAARASVAAAASAAPAPAERPPPQLLDRHGRVVDMRGGCCFDGAETCCKGSAYRRLMERHNAGR